MGVALYKMSTQIVVLLVHALHVTMSNSFLVVASKNFINILVLYVITARNNVMTNVLDVHIVIFVGVVLIF